jgi:DNA-binding transcriptional ArsR family regulator
MATKEVLRNMTKSKEETESELELARAIIQEQRLGIINNLLQEKKNVSQLADLTDLDRATVSYHLDILEKNNIVTSDYIMITEPHSKGKVGRFYSINQKVLAKAVDAFKRLQEQMTKSP